MFFVFRAFMVLITSASCSADTVAGPVHALQCAASLERTTSADAYAGPRTSLAGRRYVVSAQYEVGRGGEAGRGHSATRLGWTGVVCG